MDESVSPGKEDATLLSRHNELRARFRSLVINDIQSRDATFDLPSVEEMNSFRLGDLLEVARAVGATTPLGVMRLELMSTIPDEDAPGWKKAQFSKGLTDVETALNAYAARLEARELGRKI